MPNLALAKPIQLTDRSIERLIDAMQAGIHPRDLVKRLYPGDKQLQRVAYRKIRSAVVNDPRVLQRIHEEATLTLVTAIPAAAKALGKTASYSGSRNMPAQRLLFEATGVHNTKVKHEHSGEIKIKFEAPRPTFEGSAIDDATVVE